MISILLTVLLAQDLPQHSEGPINDFAGEIDKGTYAKIEKAIADLKAKDVRLVVATVTSLQGLSVEDYANKLTKKWGVGEKGKNNGILLLHAPKERKIRIENGYGVESRLTDIESKGVINRMIPLMKDGKYAAALLQAVEDIGRILAEKPAPAEEPEKQNASIGPPPARSGGESGIYIIIGMLVVVLGSIMIIIWLQTRPIKLDPPARKSSVFDSSLSPPTPIQTLWTSTPSPPMPYVPPIYSPPPPPRHRRDDDDDSSRRRSSSSDWGSSSSSSYDSGSSSSSSDSGSYGGGDSGGGGASGDY